MKLTPAHTVLIFSDLDGCLLNSTDYDFTPAVGQLERIRQAEIPLILSSSKTEPEMRRLADAMQLADAPLICENGGIVIWSRSPTATDAPTLLGRSRPAILEVLQQLKTDYQFRSFEDLQVDGVAQATNLPAPQAALALARSSTEPLIWDDDPGKIDAFGSALADRGLTLTRGGRFWHVAGPTTKGQGMQCVLQRWQPNAPAQLISIAIGDSPIDQSMLEIADYPIVVPGIDGRVRVQVDRGAVRTADQPGAAGWASAVGGVLDELSV